MILPVYTYGQPVLRKVAEDIESNYFELEKLIEDMFETLTAADGVGLAAPQIGKSIRVVVIDLDVLSGDLPEYKNFRKVFINPHIIGFDDNDKKETIEEGCLSIPGIHEGVTRASRIHVQYMDVDFVLHDEWVEGYLARVMQHEFDHLDGIMFVDRLSPFRKQMINGKLKAIMQGKYRCSYRTKPVCK